MANLRLITLDPGHFHAALLQKDKVPGVDRRVHVYAPLGPDLLAHLQRILGFNQRAENPTNWELEIHSGPDYLERLSRERPGTVVVLAGSNDRKIDYLAAALEAGLHVLADKPWIIRAQDHPRLQTVLALAKSRGLLAFDVMTERFEITSRLQQELVQDSEVFGEILLGTADEPGVLLESVHYLKKVVAGNPLRRPPWFFDIEKQGEGLTDVGTHLVDLVPWVLRPGHVVDPANDLALLSARRWPTLLARDEFQQITGEKDFPAELAEQVEKDCLPYFCNNEVNYRLWGVQVRLVIRWEVEAEPGTGDSHLAIFRGSRARLEIRQGREESYRPELFVFPKDQGDLGKALKRKIKKLEDQYPGLAVEDQKSRFRVIIPDRFRVGHEAHFGEVARQFLSYLADPDRLPGWEMPNLLAKYFLTTSGVELGRKMGP